VARFADQIDLCQWQPPFWFAGASPDAWAAWRDTLAELKDRIRGAAVIVADNVCEYLYAGTDQEEWDFTTDFPCCAPPFPSFFIEMRRPSAILSTARGRQEPTALPTSWGWLFRATDRGEAEERLASFEADGGNPLAWLQAALRDLAAVVDQDALQTASRAPDPQAALAALGFHEQQFVRIASTLKAVRDGRIDPHAEARKILSRVRWVLNATLVNATSQTGVVAGPLINFTFQLDDAGAVLDRPLLSLFGAHLPYFAARGPQPVIDGTSSLLFPAMLALSFMNCKNVALREHEPPPLTRKQARGRGGVPFVRHYTLDIAPMREVLRREGGAEQTGIRRALHICRGHFANYSEKGLFGKHFGRFWVPAHVRGHADHGRIKKEYAVHPPGTH
jgi:hypothetical protein